MPTLISLKDGVYAAAEDRFVTVADEDAIPAAAPVILSLARFQAEGDALLAAGRAVGDVLREQAGFMVRCGFDAFEPADGSNSQEWQAAARRYRHVYQRAADGRTPAYAERGE